MHTDSCGYSIMHALNDERDIVEQLESGHTQTVFAEQFQDLMQISCDAFPESELCRVCGVKADCKAHGACNEHHSLVVAQSFLQLYREEAGRDMPGPALMVMATMGVSFCGVLAAGLYPEHPAFRTIAQVLQGVMMVMTLPEGGAEELSAMLEDRADELAGIDLSVWGKD